MLINDSNKNNLLKMVEELLRISETDREKNLVLYKKTAEEVDKELFNRLKERIIANKTHNSLDEELLFLKEIEEEYDQLVLLQCKFINTYGLYSKEQLVLSNLNQFKIETIKNRKNAIYGLLNCNNNIEKNKQELDESNDKLANLEKAQKILNERLRKLENELKLNFLSAEGRIANSNGTLKFASVTYEYKELGYNIDEIANDDTLLDKYLSAVTIEKNEAELKWKTANLCYETSPSADSRQIVHDINLELSKVRYKYSMLKIALLILRECSNYEDVAEKRRELDDYLKCRLKYFSMIATKYAVDPINKLRLSEQMNEIQQMNDNTSRILRLRKTISELNATTEQLIKKRDEYMSLIRLDKTYFINDTDDNNKLVKSSVDDSDEFKYNDNQVIDVKRASSKLMSGIVSEKTTGVINRVFEMINGKENKNNDLHDITSVKNTKEDETVDLTIHEVNDSLEEKKETSIFNDVVPFDDDIVFFDKKDDKDIFSEESQDKSDQLFFDIPVDDEKEPILYENDAKAEISLDEQVNEIMSTEKVRSRKPII